MQSTVFSNEPLLVLSNLIIHLTKAGVERGGATFELKESGFGNLAVFTTPLSTLNTLEK
jgi:hypothetical protein